MVPKKNLTEHNKYLIILELIWNSVYEQIFEPMCTNGKGRDSMF